MKRLNSTSHYVVIHGNMEHPSAIVLDPESGFMFWSDIGKEPKLERARLDGSDRHILLNATPIYVNHIALDYKVCLLTMYSLSFIKILI